MALVLSRAGSCGILTKPSENPKELHSLGYYVASFMTLLYKGFS